MSAPKTRKQREKYEIYPLSVRLEAVRLVESGLLHRQVQQQLGVSHATLAQWLRRHGSAVYQRMKRQLFTAAQKHAIVRELLDGRLDEGAALLKYGLRHAGTLRGWVAAHQAAAAAAAPVPPPDEDAPPGAAGTLAAQLRQAQWQIEALHTLIDQAEAAYKIDIRKKAGAKPSK